MDQGTILSNFTTRHFTFDFDASFVYMGIFLTFSYSRAALKKYVKANNKITAADNMFDSLFNRAIRSGVEKGVFAQPKGTRPTPSSQSII
jgi:hypothetical protein